MTTSESNKGKDQRVVTFFVTSSCHVAPDSYRDLFGPKLLGGWNLVKLTVMPSNGIDVFQPSAQVKKEPLVALLVAELEAPKGTPYPEQKGGR